MKLQPSTIPPRNTYRGPTGDVTNPEAVAAVARLAAIRATHRDKVQAALAEVEQAELAERLR